MKKGDTVEFHIIGQVGLYRGVVKTESGHNGKAEIRVKAIRARPPAPRKWLKCDSWPILKDGDYILCSEDLVVNALFHLSPS